jgi:PKHD-type hydroxylase
MKEELTTATWALNLDTVNRYAFWNEAFSPEECKTIIDIGKTYDMYKGVTIGEKEGKEQDSDWRDSKVVFLAPTQDLRWVYEKLTACVLHLNQEYFGFDISHFGENLQFTEYNAPAGKYNTHIDKIFNGTIRKLSIVLQLTNEDEYKGGDFEIVDSGDSFPEALSRKQGTLLVFPSYTPHRVAPVTEGTRHSLVGWISGPNFK